MLIHSWANTTFSLLSPPACFPLKQPAAEKSFSLNSKPWQQRNWRGAPLAHMHTCAGPCRRDGTCRAASGSLLPEPAPHSSLPRDLLSRPQPHLQTGMVPVTSNYKDCHVPVWLSSGDTAWLGSIVGFFNLRRKSLKIFVNCCLDHQADVTEVLPAIFRSKLFHPCSSYQIHLFACPENSNPWLTPLKSQVEQDANKHSKNQVTASYQSQTRLSNTVSST